MKKLLIFLSLLVCTISFLNAQPNTFNYQAVVRDSDGNLLSDQTIHLRLSVIGEDETNYYTELHTTETNQYGQINLEVGAGAVESGDFASIPWGINELSLSTSVSIDNGTSFSELGQTPLLAVPYALFAQAGNEGPPGNGIESVDDNGDGTITFNFTDESSFTTPNLTGPLVDGDSLSILTHNGSSWIATEALKTNGESVAIGSNPAISRLLVQGDTVTPGTDPIFEVKNSNGNVIFAVYENGVEINVEESSTKRSTKGGFAVGGIRPNKTVTQYFKVTPDSIRMYLYEDTSRSTKGGFAVGGIRPNKGTINEYLRITSDSTRLYVKNAAKGRKGGFAVGGLSPNKNLRNEFLHVSSDSVRVYIDQTSGKGRKGGFAVGGLSPNKSGSSDFFNVEFDTTQIINPSEPRILFYPIKNAFIAGQVLIESADSVGINSIATGYEAKAIGAFSQALGFRAIARGINSTAIGNQAIVNNSNSYALGNNTFVSNLNSYAIGNSAKVSGEGSYAIGSGALAQGDFSFAIGSDGVDPGGFATNVTRALGNYSYAFGMGSLAENTGSFSLGSKTEATGEYSLALGNGTIASGYSSTAMGDGTEASGERATAMGFWTTASGTSSTAMGQSTTAIGESSTAIGKGAIASGFISTAMGQATTASGFVSTAIGNGSTASGESSVAIGGGSEAAGRESIALGRSNHTTGEFSYAFGSNLTAKSHSEVVVGSNNDTTYSLTTNSWVLTEPLFTIGNAQPGGPGHNALMVLKNGSVGIGGYPGATGANVLALNTTGIGHQPPTDTIPDGILLFAQNINASTELRVMDGGGNITTLSPHSFTLTNKSEPMAWSFFSENKKLGYKINVDMLKAIRTIEQLSGEKLVYLQDIESHELINKKNNKASLVEIVKKQQEKIATLEKANNEKEKLLEQQKIILKKLQEQINRINEHIQN